MAEAHSVEDRKPTYETVYEGPVIRYPIPAHATPGYHKDADLNYLYFRYGVEKGHVGLHVHNLDESFAGRKANVQVTIVKKTMPNGNVYYTVDLIPSDERPQPKKLFILRGALDDWTFEGMTAKDIEGTVLPKPLVGAIMIVPRKAKIMKKK